ncbi:MAG: efflux RND transporter periplasmic adaptor subunit [Erythrobacter sp.]|nr:efflux RND transporter periplasmic adaptor subunit [Erythrobacter sp.]
MNYSTTIRAEAAEPVTIDAQGAQAESRRGLGRKVLIGGAMLFGLLLAIAAYFALAGGEPIAAGDDESQAPVVTVVAPGQTTIDGVIEAPGTLAARRAMPVGVEGEGGRVISVPVDAGEWVSAGQVLAVIDRSVQTQQAAAQAAQIEVARADARLAQANLERALKLVERGFISTADIDRLTAERDSANARVRVAEAQLAELRARNARLNVVAPAAGYVLSRNVEPGQTVGPGTAALFTIAQGGQMELLAQVNENQLARLSQGVNAEVVLAGSDKTFKGQVWQLSPTIDENTRQGIARIALPFAPALRPGGFATARINGGTFTATVLPESAVLADDEGAFVYIVDDENKAVVQRVQTGVVTEQGIAITEGLSGNELVVLRAGGFLNPGETVNPQRATGNAKG